MDRAIVDEIEIAFGKRFVGARAGNLGFEIVEFALIAQIEPVNENGRIFVGIGIVRRIVHATLAQVLR